MKYEFSAVAENILNGEEDAYRQVHAFLVELGISGPTQGLSLDQITPNQPMAVKKAGLVEGLKYVRGLIFKGLLLPNGGGNQSRFICRSE